MADDDVEKQAKFDAFTPVEESLGYLTLEQSRSGSKGELMRKANW